MINADLVNLTGAAKQGDEARIAEILDADVGLVNQPDESGATALTSRRSTGIAAWCGC